MRAHIHARKGSAVTPQAYRPVMNMNTHLHEASPAAHAGRARTQQHNTCTYSHISYTSPTTLLLLLSACVSACRGLSLLVASHSHGLASTHSTHVQCAHSTSQNQPLFLLSPTTVVQSGLLLPLLHTPDVHTRRHADTHINTQHNGTQRHTHTYTRRHRHTRTRTHRHKHTHLDTGRHAS